MKEAVWITRRTNSAPAMLLRREFDIDRPVRRATLCLSGLGFFVAWLNGERVGDSMLDPAQSDYDKRIFRVSHDVTHHLALGCNAIAAELGDGWFNQTRVRILSECVSLAYGSPRLWAELYIVHEDGSESHIVSDTDWKTATGGTRENNIYAGECYDARLAQPGWNATHFDDSAWELSVQAFINPVPFIEQNFPPIRIIETLSPVAITALGEGKFIVDMGQNFAGWVRISPRAPRGTDIRLRFAEILDAEGNVDTASTGVFATGVEQIDTYICSGEAGEIWEPSFTYHGFRFVEVVGWVGELIAADILGRVVHTDLPVAGKFECSDERLNAVHRLALWTHRSNIMSVPIDCPARERCGWLGDANTVAQYSMWNFQGKEFWEKYLGDIETSRALNGGLPCHIAPGKRTCGTASPDWAVTLVVLPWYIYRHYGDPAVLERHWHGMHELMQHFGEIANNWILEEGIGDHLFPDAHPNAKKTPIALTSTAWFYSCAEIMRDTAQLLGYGGYANLYANWAENIHTALVKNFWRDGSFGTQTGNAMALTLGFAPEEKAAASALAAAVHQCEIHHDCGIFGIRFIFEALTRHGFGDLALAIMHGDTYPSLGDILLRGATTLWECWEGVTNERTYGARSLNHPMMGGYDNWFFNTLAGIAPIEPGFKKFSIEPYPIAGLDWVRCYHDSSHGRISSQWRIENGVFLLQISIPQNTTALVRMPFSGVRHSLAPGEYSLDEAIPVQQF